MTAPDDDPTIFHITTAAAWRAAEEAGSYALSTKGRTLAEEGFIHASFRRQVPMIGDLLYRGATEPIVVLEIEPSRLDVEVRVENLDGGAELFPHLYGPLPLSAVVAVHPAGMRDGLFTFPV